MELESKVNEVYVKTTVKQKFKNPEKTPLELQIYLDKNDNLLFNSFQAKIGDSIVAKSKIIKKEKANVKYTDTIASGNAAIFVAETDKNIIINMGNIPPKEEVIFISEFLHFIKFSDCYEFELFRNLPIFIGKDDEKYTNTKLEEKIYIKTKNKISTLSKDINVTELQIKEEKYLNEEKNEYFISYEIGKLPSYYYKEVNTSKIYFDIVYTEPKIFLQKSAIFNEDNYIIQYKYKNTQEELEISPALFIFLIDQSGSMSGNRIIIAKKALELSLQSLPAKSYYQLIGFGSTFVKYDETPKEYTKENIQNSILTIEKIEANLCGTDIYYPLKKIYENKIYDEINLSKNIFLITDGHIIQKEETLELIKSNNSKFRIFSIGIGNGFDADLIKRSGLFGKGSYNYCRDINELNSVVAKEINNVNRPWVSELKLNCDLDNENIIKKTESPDLIKYNSIINFNYIIPRKNNDKIKFEIIVSLDGENGKKEEIKNNYEIIPMEFPEGEEFSKLLIKNDLKNNSEKEKLDKAIKYQLLNENTALFAKIELSNQITDEMKTKIIGDKEKNVLELYKPKSYSYYNNMGMNPMMNPSIGMGMGGMNTMMSQFNPNYFGMNNMMNQSNGMNPMMMNQPMGMNRMGMNPMMMNQQMGMNQMGMNPMMMNQRMGMNQMGIYSMMMNHNMSPMMGMNQMMNQSSQMMKQYMGMMNQSMGMMGMNPMMNQSMNMNNMNNMNNINLINQMKMNANDNNLNNSSSETSKEDKEKMEKIVEKNKKIKEEKEKERKYEEESLLKKEELERKKSVEKEKIMTMIKTQDYIEGFWDVNEMTKFIFEKYKKEYDLLKEKNISDKVAMTILIIYYLKNEHFELLTELVMVIKKGQLYIKKETNCSYEEIIEKIK